MKKISLFSLLFLFGIGVYAQAPQVFKYQAVARDGSGNILANRSVSFRISILSGSTSGSAVFIETHTGKSTNSFGLVDLEIGKGTPLSGTFTTIPWGSNTYFIKVEMDPAGGAAYQAMGTSQLLSVPYALYAKDVQNNNDADADPSNELQKISLSGTTLTLDKSGGSVTLPSSGGADNWGTQTVVTDGTLTGNGTTTLPLKIADNGITSVKIQDGTVTSPDLANSAVTTDRINNAAVTAPKLASMGASSGQVLKWNGSVWEPNTDLTGTGGGVPGGSNGLVQFNNGGTFGGNSNFFWDNSNQRLGLGNTSPGALLDLKTNSSVSYPHLLLNENETDYARMMFKNTGSPSKNWTIAGLTNASDANSRLNFYYHNGSSGSDIISITGDGMVGIGTFSPRANLDVSGSAVIGSSGLIISEFRELTGTLTGTSITISYPSGYTINNIRVISFFIWDTQYWVQIPWSNNLGQYVDFSIKNSGINVTSSTPFTNVNYRILIMRVQ